MHFCQPKNKIKNICEILYKTAQKMHFFALFTIFLSAFYRKYMQKRKKHHLLYQKRATIYIKTYFCIKTKKIFVNTRQ